MASFTALGDSVTLNLSNKGEVAAVALSGTYAMTIQLQKEVGSPGSGAWLPLKEWSTANATVAYNHTATEDAESLRLIVTVDTSGTCTATLTDALDQQHYIWKDPQGNSLMRFTQGGVELGGAIRRLASYGVGAIGPTYSIAAALSVTREVHAGRIGLFQIAAGVTVTLPAATGTGDVYKFYVDTTVTSVEDKIAAAGTDVMQGGVAIATDIGGVVMITAATTDYIAMNGTTTGGVKGSTVTLTDVVSGAWLVEGFLISTGAEADPFGIT